MEIFIPVEEVYLSFPSQGQREDIVFMNTLDRLINKNVLRKEGDNVTFTKKFLLKLLKKQIQIKTLMELEEV